MNIAVMQPYLLPYLGYFQLVAAVDVFVLFDDVNFIKQGWIHRNRFLRDGEPIRFTLPVKHASQNRLISEHDFVDLAASREEVLRLADRCYSTASHHQQTRALLAELLSHTDANVARFVGHSVRCVSRHLGVETKIVQSSELEKPQGLRGAEKILAICRLLGADHYLNPIGGTELYDRERFRASGIELQFLKTRAVTYAQGRQEFTPNLSIIDVLMYNGVDGTRKLIRECDFV